jgi:hypothetical protein
MKRKLAVPALAAAIVAIAGGVVGGAQPVLPVLPNTVQEWNKIAEGTVVGSGAFQGEGGST